MVTEGGLFNIPNSYLHVLIDNKIVNLIQTVQIKRDNLNKKWLDKQCWAQSFAELSESDIQNFIVDIYGKLFFKPQLGYIEIPLEDMVTIHQDVCLQKRWTVPDVVRDLEKPKLTPTGLNNFTEINQALNSACVETPTTTTTGETVRSSISLLKETLNKN